MKPAAAGILGTLTGPESKQTFNSALINFPGFHMDGMMTPAATALILVLLLQIKHFVCDGPLQTKEMVHAKGIYGRPLGILHAAIHGGGTLVVFAATGFAWSTVLLFAALDFVIHYHIDFTKEIIVRHLGWTMAVPYFWWMIALDQLLHHVTYIALVAYSQGMF